VTQDAVANRLGQVESIAVVLQLVDDAETLLIVPEAWHDGGQRSFSGMTEGSVTQIVTHANRSIRSSFRPSARPMVRAICATSRCG
jgi:hypothetical protein